MKKSRIFSLVLAAAIAVGSFTISTYAVSGEPSVITADKETELKSLSKSGLYTDGGIVFDYKTGSYNGAYTGLAKTKTGTIYYDNGKQYYGWRKLNGNWYYFDKNNGGTLAKGSFTIGSDIYVFTDKGRWTGKLSSDAAKPSDFAATYLTMNTSGEFFSADTDKNEILYSSGKMISSAKGKLDCLQKDLQIIYSSMREYGVDTLTFPMIAEYLEAEGTNSAYDESTAYFLSFTINGTNIVVTGNSSFWNCTATNQSAEGFGNFLRFLESYLATTDGYGQVRGNDNKINATN